MAIGSGWTGSIRRVLGEAHRVLVGETSQYIAPGKSPFRTGYSLEVRYRACRLSLREGLREQSSVRSLDRGVCSNFLSDRQAQ